MENRHIWILKYTATLHLHETNTIQIPLAAQLDSSNLLQ